MKLSLCQNRFYRVKKGQTAAMIAEVYGVSPRLLAKVNGLGQEVEEGQLVVIPKEGGNLYTVRGGESKTLLCGSEENFERKNGTKCFYVGQIILI